MLIVFFVYFSRGKQSSKSSSKSGAKRSTSGRNSAKSTTDSNFIQQNIQFKKGNAFLDESESEYLKNEFFGSSEGCHKCQYNQSINKHGKFCSHVDFKYPLLLTKWCPWQTSSQGFYLAGHSSRTSKFCKLMGFIEEVKKTSVVDKYENKMKRNLNEEDVLNTNNEDVSLKKISLPKKKQKKNDIGKAWRQNYAENFKDPEGSEDDDFASLNAVKKVIELKQYSSRIEEEDEDLKPCSLEKLLKKVDSGLKDQKKGRVRLTKLPKLPIRGSDIATIEDNQLDFCSQISMDTLYNRIRKKSNPLLKTLFDEINEANEITDEATEEIVEVNNPVLDWIRNIQGNTTELQGEEEGVLSPTNYKNVIIDDEDDDNCLFIRKKTERQNVPEEFDKIDKDDRVGKLLPLSSPKNLRSGKPRNVCVVTPIMRESVPEPPTDIDLNWLNFDDNSKKGCENENVINNAVPDPPCDVPEFLDCDDDIGDEISLDFRPAAKKEKKTNLQRHLSDVFEPVSDAPEPHSDVPGSLFGVSEHLPDAPEHLPNAPELHSDVPEPRIDVPEHLPDAPEHLPNAPELHSDVPEPRFDVPEHLPDAPEYHSNISRHLFDVPPLPPVININKDDLSRLSHNEKVVRTPDGPKTNKVTEETSNKVREETFNKVREETSNKENDMLFTKGTNKKILFTKICEESKWKKSEFGMLDDTLHEELNGSDNDMSTSPPMLSQYVSKFNSGKQLCKEVSVKTEPAFTRETENDVEIDISKIPHRQRKQDQDFIRSSESNFNAGIVRKVGNKTFNILQKFQYKKPEDSEVEESNMFQDDRSVSIAKVPNQTSTFDNGEQSPIKRECDLTSTPPSETTDDGSPVIKKKRNVAVRNENCFSPVSPTAHKDNSNCKDYDKSIVHITKESPTNDNAHGKGLCYVFCRILSFYMQSFLCD